MGNREPIGLSIKVYWEPTILISKHYQDYGVKKVAHNIVDNPVMGERSMTAVMAQDKYCPHHCSLKEPIDWINSKVLKYPVESQGT